MDLTDYRTIHYLSVEFKLTDGMIAKILLMDRKKVYKIRRIVLQLPANTRSFHKKYKKYIDK